MGVIVLCCKENVCVWSVDTHCVHIQSSLSVFTKLGTAVLSSLHSGVVVQLWNSPSIFTPSWLCLVWTYLSTHQWPGYGRTYHSAQRTNNAQTPYPKWVHEYPDSTISKVLTILKWRMIPTLIRKKQRAEPLCSQWGTHTSFFYNVNATVRQF